MSIYVITLFSVRDLFVILPSPWGTSSVATFQGVYLRTWSDIFFVTGLDFCHSNYSVNSWITSTTSPMRHLFQGKTSFLNSTNVPGFTFYCAVCHFFRACWVDKYSSAALVPTTTLLLLALVSNAYYYWYFHRLQIFPCCHIFPVRNDLMLMSPGRRSHHLRSLVDIIVIVSFIH